MYEAIYIVGFNKDTDVDGKKNSSPIGVPAKVLFTNRAP